eukprot:5141765-Amphidinium_carterae.2
METEGESAKKKQCIGEVMSPTLADVMQQLQSIQACLAQLPQLAQRVNTHDTQIQDLESRLAQ